MNPASENTDPETTTATAAASEVTPALPPWLRRLLARNPFYLVSAAMMLYGLYLVAIDPQLVEQEGRNLAFNFSSLQIYELLLVITAIALAARRIWYDSSLLVLLENLFVFVPFILVSQVATLETDLDGRTLLGTGVFQGVILITCGFLVLRFWLLQRYHDAFRLNGYLLTAGLVLMVFNLIMPVQFRSAIENDIEAWTRLSPRIWMIALPLILATLNLAPRFVDRGHLALQRRWMPMVLFSLWLAAAAVHLRTLDYMDSIRFQPHHLAVLLWVAAWTLRHRIGEFIDRKTPRLMNGLLIPPLLLPLLASTFDNSLPIFVMSGINIAVFGMMYRRDRSNPMAFQFMLASLAFGFAAVPEALGEIAVPGFSRYKVIELGITIYLLIATGGSRKPGYGALAAILAGFLVARYIEHLDYLGLYALQTGLIFALIHSLFWFDSPRNHGQAIRVGAALALVVHSAVWGNIVNFRTADIHVGWMLILNGLLLIAAWWLLGKRLDGCLTLVVPIAGAATLLSVPANFIFEALRITPSGHLTILGSFVLFALGTALALTKQRWVGDTAKPLAAPAPATGSE